MKLKKLFLLFVLSLSAFAAKASGDLASLDDKKLLCEEIKNAYDDPESELTINLERCLRNRTIKIYSAGAAQTLVSGMITFYRKEVKDSYLDMKCQIIYIGKPASGNNSDVVCGY